jgi:hypothetical protein
MTTIEQLGGLTAQHNEIIKRVVHGSLNPTFVKRALQDIIEGVMKPLPVVEQVERQLDVWKNFGVEISDERWEQILQQADVFEPVTDSDEPLVTGGFGYNNPSLVVMKLFGVFEPPQGYVKHNNIEHAQLSYAPGMKPKGELRLVHYDPNAYPQLSPERARKEAKKDGVRLASIEVFEHLALQPRLGLTWDGKLYFFPNASGLDQKRENGSTVPFVDRHDNAPRTRKLFELDLYGVDNANVQWSSPVVREC